MPVSFTESQMRLLQDAQRVLLSVQTAEDLDTWTTEVFHVLRPLLNTSHLYFLQPSHVSSRTSNLLDETPRSDGASARNGSSAFPAHEAGDGASHPESDSLLVWSPSLGEEFARGIKRHFVGFEDGFSIFREAYPTTMHRLIRAAGAGAVHDAPFHDPTRRKRLDLHQEVFRPVRVVRQMALAQPLPQGEALLIAGFDEAEVPDYNGTRHQILQLLAPVFETSLKLLWQLKEASRRFTTMIDALPEALIAFDADGAESHRNRAFQNLPVGEPDRAVLVRTARKLAAGIGPLHEPISSPQPLTAQCDLSIATGSYQLRAFIAPSLTTRPGVLVLVERDALLPPPGRLQARYGLTPRQAEVALLMAEGLSDRAVAERLVISPHTARRHAEAVLKKMNLSSRAGVALACVQASASA
jgi:DNA-binding CsgD family transcriptional regulator